MSALSPTQRQCLAEVRLEPGMPVGELPGGLRSVLALMRRELVERAPGVGDQDPRRWRIYAPHHEHLFDLTMHLDGCHWWSFLGTCYCGATITVRGERNPGSDPWSCSRCEQLRAGGRIAPRAVELIGARNRVEA